VVDKVALIALTDGDFLDFKIRRAGTDLLSPCIAHSWNALVHQATLRKAR
jgi:hypothetical protein